MAGIFWNFKLLAFRCERSKIVIFVNGGAPLNPKSSENAVIVFSDIIYMLFVFMSGGYGLVNRFSFQTNATALVGGMSRWCYDIRCSMLDQGYGTSRGDIMMVLWYRVQYVRPRLPD